MKFDPYQPCVCASGKKLKFCCAAQSDEIDRVVKMIDADQHDAALQRLELNDKKTPRLPWVPVLRGELMINHGKRAQAVDYLADATRAFPDNDYLVGLHAVAALLERGFAESKKLVRKGIQRCIRMAPPIVHSLANWVAEELTESGHPLAARSYLVLALRLAPERRREEAFQALFDLESNLEIAYPLRGANPWPEVTGLSPAADAEHKKAAKFAGICGWDLAAEIMATLAAGEGAALPTVWHILGLCQAADLNEAGAVESFRTAAKLYAAGDEESIARGIECTMLADLLAHRNLQFPSVTRLWRRGKVSDQAALEQRLRDQPRIRVTIGNDQQGLNARLFARDLPSGVFDPEQAERQSPDTWINQLAELSIFAGGTADVSTLESEDAEAFPLIEEATRGLVEWQTDVEKQPISRDLVEFGRERVSMQCPSVVARAQDARVAGRRYLFEVFPDQPLDTFGGKSLRQVASDPAGRVAATGFLVTIEAVLGRSAPNLEIEALIAHLGLPPIPKRPASGDIGASSAFDLLRTDPATMTDQQLAVATGRAVVIRHPRLIRTHVIYTLRKSSARGLLPDAAQAFGRVAEVLRTQSVDAALEWLNFWKECLPPANIRDRIGMILEELIIRGVRHADPEIDRLWVKVEREILAKLPEARAIFEHVLGLLEIPPERLDQAQVTTLWTPDGGVEEGSRKTLWVPGQD